MSSRVVLLHHPVGIPVTFGVAVAKAAVSLVYRLRPFFESATNLYVLILQARTGLPCLGLCVNSDFFRPNDTAWKKLLIVSKLHAVQYGAAAIALLG